MSTKIAPNRFPVWDLSCALFLPPLAWLMHLLASVTIAEWVCMTSSGEPASFLGVSRVSWVLIVLTCLAASAAVVGVRAAHQSIKAARRHDHVDSQAVATQLLIARVGFWGGAMFLVVIMAES